MIFWTIKWIITSCVLIMLLHYFLNFLKDTLTVPKIKDLVNNPSERYNEIINMLNNNQNADSMINNFNTNGTSNIDANIISINNINAKNNGSKNNNANNSANNNNNNANDANNSANIDANIININACGTTIHADDHMEMELNTFLKGMKGINKQKTR